MGGGAVAALGADEGIEAAAGAPGMVVGGPEGFFIAGGGGGRFSSSPSGFVLSTHRFLSASQTI